MRFNNHEIDVLVCTTIVENGIDVPNANTILIENAQDLVWRRSIRSKEESDVPTVLPMPI